MYRKTGPGLPDSCALYTPCIYLACALDTSGIGLIWCRNLTDIASGGTPYNAIPRWYSDIICTDIGLSDTACLLSFIRIITHYNYGSRREYRYEH